MTSTGGWQVEFYEDERGRSPVEAFILALDRKMYEKVLRALDILRDSGPNQRMPLARPVTGERFWELRVQTGGNIVRLFYFSLVERRIVLLHGFVKKDRRIPRGELEIARRRYAEVVRRQP